MKTAFFRPAAWSLVALCGLAVLPANAADAPNEVEQLKESLRKAENAVADLQAENKLLAASLKDEQLKNALAVDDEVKRLRDLLRFMPALEREKGTLEKELKKTTAQLQATRGELDTVRRELAAVKPTQPEDPKTAPRRERAPQDGPTPDQLKRLGDSIRRADEPKPQPADPEAAKKAELEALEREREALKRELDGLPNRERAVPGLDPARVEAEVRAARLEAQLHVIQGAFESSRRETARLREELHAEHRARVELAARAAADPKVIQRIENLEAVMTKLSVALDNLMKRVDGNRQEK